MLLCSVRASTLEAGQILQSTRDGGLLMRVL